MDPHAISIAFIFLSSLVAYGAIHVEQNKTEKAKWEHQQAMWSKNLEIHNLENKLAHQEDVIKRLRQRIDKLLNPNDPKY